MRKIIKFAACALISLLFIQCVDKPNSPAPTLPDYIVNVNDTITFRVGEKALIQPVNLEIGFDSVISDKRCPWGYICLWPEPAVVRFWIKQPDMDTIFATANSFSLGFVPTERAIDPIDTLDMRFSLIALQPYPINQNTIPQELYQAWMEVKNLNCHFSFVDSVIISDLPRDSIEFDRFEITRSPVLGDSLKIDVSYSGGCQEHEFQLYMSPASFAETDPVQADLYLRHDAHGDLCEALIQRSLYFDLGPISRLHEDIYGYPDTIMLKLYYYQEDYARSELYIPGNLGE